VWGEVNWLFLVRYAIVESAIRQKGCGMDLDALAALASNTLVATAVTDAFEALGHKISRLFGCGKPDAGIERRLDSTRQELAMTTPGELGSVQVAHAGRWRTRFADLLAEHPEVEAELSAIVAEFGSTAPDYGGNMMNTITGSVLKGPVVMGRDFGDIMIGSPQNPTVDG